MIDTKAYRQQTVDTPHNNIAIINAMCDELDRLYALEAKTNRGDCYGQPSCSHGGIDKNSGTNIVYHDKHCRIKNDAPIHAEYENAYCTCKHRHINIPDLVERTKREISQLKMVSPETGKKLLARISELEDAINKHKSAANGSNWTYSYYDKELYTVLRGEK